MEHLTDAFREIQFERINLDDLLYFIQYADGAEATYICKNPALQQYQEQLDGDFFSLLNKHLPQKDVCVHDAFGAAFNNAVNFYFKVGFYAGLAWCRLTPPSL